MEGKSGEKTAGLQHEKSHSRIIGLEVNRGLQSIVGIQLGPLGYIVYAKVPSYIRYGAVSFITSELVSNHIERLHIQIAVTTHFLARPGITICPCSILTFQPSAIKALKTAGPNTPLPPVEWCPWPVTILNSPRDFPVLDHS